LAYHNGGGRFAGKQAVFLALGTFAEASGVLTYHWCGSRGHPADLIEFK